MTNADTSTTDLTEKLTLKAELLLFTVGTGDGWNCHTAAGVGIHLRPVPGGEAWDWSAHRAWAHGTGTGQAESREAAIQGALQCLIEAGFNIDDLPCTM